MTRRLHSRRATQVPDLAEKRDDGVSRVADEQDPAAVMPGPTTHRPQKARGIGEVGLGQVGEQRDRVGEVLREKLHHAVWPVDLREALRCYSF